MGVVLGLLFDGLAWMLVRLVGVSAESLSKKYRDDHVYKKNVQDLIERNKQFGKTE